MRLLRLSLWLLPLFSACRGVPPRTGPLIRPPAAAAFSRARVLFENGEPGALGAAETCLTLAPDWVAPRRLIDDILMADLLGPRALAAHRAALTFDPEDAGALYLAGRLETPAASRRLFQRASELAPELPWPHHGLAVRASQAGRTGQAIRLERLALERADDPWEAAYFRNQLARFLAAGGDEDAGLAVLREGLVDGRLEPDDRLWLRVQLAVAELSHGRSEVRKRGLRRCTRLVAEEPVTEASLRALFSAARSFTVPPELISALLAREGEERRRLAVEAVLGGASSQLAYHALARDPGHDERLARDRNLRLRALEAGDGARVLRAWRQALPPQVVDASGMPEEERLRVLVECAEALGSAPGGGGLDVAASVLFGEALLDAGWFAEASAHARDLARLDADAALELERQALAGQEALSELVSVVRAVQRGRGSFPFLEAEERSAGGGASGGGSGDRSGGEAAVARVELDAEAPPEARVRGLGGLLQVMGVLLAEQQLSRRPPGSRSAGDRLELEEQRRQVAESPRIGYWILGQVVHPGPRFSRQDEALGRGSEGEQVPGLARRMADLLRFAVVGTSIGAEAPDATILRRLWVEERSGSHLGVPWSGTVAWCDGVDLAGMATRGGAEIAGAALHEGYYVDVAPLRRGLLRWRQLEEEYSGPGARERVVRVLATPALHLQPGSGEDAHLATGPLLGATERLRLAILAGRGDPGSAEAPLGSMSLEELVDLTERHEEGHLCDRTRFYPPGAGLWTLFTDVVLRGLVAGGQEGVMSELEYRAQLIALCVAEDPRVGLVELLAAADGNFAGGTPHGPAYVRLLEDLLETLDDLRAGEPEAWSALHPSRLFVHDLHRLDAEQVRSASIVLARQRGLVLEGWGEEDR